MEEREAAVGNRIGCATEFPAGFQIGAQVDGRKGGLTVRGMRSGTGARPYSLFG